MPLQTEKAEDRYQSLDQWPADAVLSALADGHAAGVAAARSAIAEIAVAAEHAAAALRGNGRLVYLGAGSSGLIALNDALEIPQTYGVADDRIVISLAGGVANFEQLNGLAEDRAETGVADIAGVGPMPGDVVIGISASGSTPYTVAGLSAAKAAGATTVAIACNADAPLFDGADVAILLSTPPEVIAGSTRMGAGTAQKAALNMLSTLIAVQLGHVYGGLMVNLRADNAKLRARLRAIVMRIAGVDEAAADAAILQANNSGKHAILIAAGAAGLDDASDLLAAVDDHTRKAMQALSARSTE